VNFRARNRHLWDYSRLPTRIGGASFGAAILGHVVAVVVHDAGAVEAKQQHHRREFSDRRQLRLAVADVDVAC
jgi:hypothetical protein